MQSKEYKVKALMRIEGIDGALVSSPENFHYVTGFASHQHTVSRSPLYSAALLRKEDTSASYIMVMDFERDSVQAQSDMDVEQYDTWVGVRTLQQIEENQPASQKTLLSFFDILKRTVNKTELTNKTIGIEMDFIPLNFYQKLKQVFPEVRFVDISPLFLAARKIKTEEEITVFRELTRVQDTALKHARAYIETGRTEKEIADIYRQKVMESNYCAPSAWSMFATGENASRLGLPTDRKIQNGDIFKYDGGVNKEFDFYTTDFSRSYLVGNAAPYLHEIKERLYEAQRLMLSRAKPGMEFQELFHIGYEYVKKKYACYQRGHLGHSISMGPQTAEPPFINATNTDKLEAGMILCVEVPLYIEGVGGFNLEDMIVVTENGVEVLTPRTPHF